MLRGLISRARRIWGGYLKMAAFWNSIFVLLVPIGLAVLIQWPSHYVVAFALMIVGMILGGIGLGFTIRDERKRNNEDKLRIWREKAFLRTLLHTAETLGVDVSDIVREMENDEDRPNVV
jgi:cytochrome bd-type quinol oxidase subunit 2